ALAFVSLCRRVHPGGGERRARQPHMVREARAVGVPYACRVPNHTRRSSYAHSTMGSIAGAGNGGCRRGVGHAGLGRRHQLGACTLSAALPAKLVNVPRMVPWPRSPAWLPAMYCSIAPGNGVVEKCRANTSV